MEAVRRIGVSVFVVWLSLTNTESEASRLVVALALVMVMGETHLPDPRL